MPTSTQRFRLVGEDDASKAFLEVAAASKLLKTSMDDVNKSALGLGKLFGGASLIPIMAGAVAATAELTTSLGAASGALGILGLSVGGIAVDMKKSQEAMSKTALHLQTLTKGTDAYKETLQKLHAQQRSFQQDFGPAAKGLSDLKVAFHDFKDATSDVSLKVMHDGLELVAGVLPKLVPVANAAGHAVDGLIGDLSKWTEGSSFKHLLHFLETSGPKDITAFGHSIGNVLSGLGGILANFVGPGDKAAKTLEHLTENFAKWGHSKGVSQGTKGFLKYVRDNGPQITSTFNSLAQAAPKIAVALGRLGSANLSVTSRFLNLIAGMPQGAFNVVVTGLFGIAAAAKAITLVTGIGAIAKGLTGLAGGKGLTGTVGKSGGGIAGGLGVQKVYVVNMGPGGMGGGPEGTATKAAWAAGLGAALKVAFRAAAVGGVSAGDINNEVTNKYDKARYGMTLGQIDPKMVKRLAELRRSVDDTVPHWDALKAHVATASREIEQIGPHAKNMSKASVAAIAQFNKAGLDGIKAHAADASRNLEQIGPHTQQATRTAIGAVGNLTAAIRAIPDKHINISANTSQAMASLRVMKAEVDALHNKTIIIRAIGGHVPGDPGSGGGGAGGGASRGFRGLGQSIMDGIVDGIKDRQIPLENAMSRVADLVSKMKDKVTRLTGVKQGFAQTFQPDNVFGTDLSGGGGIEALIAAQDAQAKQASQLNTDVKAAGRLGLSKSLINKLRSQGTSGAAALHAIVTGSPDRIALLNSLDRQTNADLRAAGLRAGNDVRGGHIGDDIRRAQKQERTLDRLEHRLHELDQTLKKDQTITVEIDGEAIITSIVRRNKRKGVKHAQGV